MNNTAKHYFECHITIEPVFDEDREKVSTIASKHGFKLAKLLMQKRQEDSAERSKYDTFMTSHSKLLDDMKSRMKDCCIELINSGFSVWRYKIEDVILDSRIDDCENLLGDKSENI